jgi:hypothetical protein
MAKQARRAVGAKELTALADRGYFKGEEIADCEQAHITTLMPKPLTSNSKADGRFDKRDFVYIAQDDEYLCPAGQRAIKRFTTIERGLTLHKYWSSACPKCPIKAQCTMGDYRRIARWEHEAVLDAMQDRLDRQPGAMRLTLSVNGRRLLPRFRESAFGNPDLPFRVDTVGRRLLRPI